jgi:signal peptidase I
VSDDLYLGPSVLEPGAPATGDHLARKLLIPLIVVLMLLLLIFQLLFDVTVVRGESMEPTLQDGDRLLLTKSYRQAAERDIVVFEVMGESGQPEDLVKRVVALPGETIEVRKGIALVNGVVEPASAVRTSDDDGTYSGPAAVPAGHVYVLGDNRPVALDSRDFGPISLQAVRGRVVYIFSPLTRMRSVR